MKEMQDRLGEDPELAAAYRAAHERYLAARAERSGERAGDRGHLRRRDARPGQVPARAGRPVARPGPRREPARRRGARPARRWWAPGPCVTVESRVTVAAIDCGTNTIKLLIGDLPDVAVRESRIVRLGQGVDRDRPARRRGAGADVRRDRRVRRADRASTTSTADPVLRHLGHPRRRERRGVRRRRPRRGSGSRPRCCPGDEEAALAFDGAVRHLRDDAGRAGAGDRHRRRLDRADPRRGRAPPTAAHSMDIGSVRLHERHLHSDPPTAGRGRRLRRPTSTPPSTRCPVDAGRRGDGGRGRRHGHSRWRPGCSTCRRTTATSSTRPCCPVADVLAFVDRLVAMPVAERLALPWMHPGRADVIGAGALILAAGAAAYPRRHAGRLRGRHPRRDRLVDRRVIAPGVTRSLGTGRI